MFEGRRLLVGIAGLGLLGLLGWVVSATLSVKRINDQETQQATRRYEHYARDYLNCLSVTTEATLADCVRKKDEAAKDHEYDAGDLGAQQDMSTWTYGLFWLGVLGFIPGGIGLLLLVENVLVVKDQMREAERVSRNQSKAYLAASSCRLTWEKDGHPKLHITYKNGGVTPAVRVREVISFKRDTRPPAWTADEGIPRGIITGASTEPVERFIEAFKILESFDPVEREVLVLWIYVFYEDVYGVLYRSGTAFVVADADVQAETDVDLVVFHQQDEPLFQEAPAEEQARYRDSVAVRKAFLIRRVKNTYKAER